MIYCGIPRLACKVQCSALSSTAAVKTQVIKVVIKSWTEPQTPFVREFVRHNNRSTEHLGQSFLMLFCSHFLNQVLCTDCVGIIIEYHHMYHASPSNISPSLLQARIDADMLLDLPLSIILSPNSLNSFPNSWLRTTLHLIFCQSSIAHSVLNFVTFHPTELNSGKVRTSKRYLQRPGWVRWTRHSAAAEDNPSVRFLVTENPLQ